MLLLLSIRFGGDILFIELPSSALAIAQLEPDPNIDITKGNLLQYEFNKTYNSINAMVH